MTHGPNDEPRSRRSEKIRVVIADDHPGVRRELRNILDDAQDIEVVGEANSSDEVTEQLRRTPCNVLLLDITIAGTTGLDLLERVTMETGSVSVLVITMQPEEPYAARALEAGASGYMTNRSAPESL